MELAGFGILWWTPTLPAIPKVGNGLLVVGLMRLHTSVFSTPLPKVKNLILGENMPGDGFPRWKELPNKWVFRPWEAPADILESSGLDLGDNYPEPCIDHTEGRTRALAALATLKTLPLS